MSSLCGVLVLAETLDYDTTIDGHQHLAPILVETAVELRYGPTLRIAHLALGLTSLLVDYLLEGLLSLLFLLLLFLQLLGDLLLVCRESLTRLGELFFLLFERFKPLLVLTAGVAQLLLLEC